MKKDSNIYIAGHRGLVGSAIRRRLESEGYMNLILRTRKELDLTDRNAVRNFFEKKRPEYVFQAAARVGGILENKTYPADFIYENLTTQNNIISSAHESGVTKLLFLGSACIYPKLAPQPIKEDYFLDGKLEPTNIAYAIAKIAGVIECQSYNKQYGTNFISLMPNNLYGPNDNFDLASSHVIPAFIRKFHEAKRRGDPKVIMWGTGSPKREFLHVDDLADACVFLMNMYDDGELINIGTGTDLSIKELAELVKEVVGYEGAIEWDTSKPDGTPRRLLDTAKLDGLGWRPKISLNDGLRGVYAWYTEHESEVA